ncbi:hypothetical protein [Myroides sp.]|uniref:hypothetical protein n=1 Tax=Myroides sp. TaxID=1874736 RepID=UPI003F3D0237
MCHAFDFEQITINQIDEFIESKPDYWREDLLLIPFAHTGSGEWYAFYYNMQDEEEVPIVLLQLMSSALIMAKNLDDFIFRMILESACIGFYNYTQDDNGESEIKNRNSLIRMIQSHRKYLPIQRKLIIDEVFDKPLFYQNNDAGMISESELNDFFNETIAFKHLNYEFDYLID